MQSDKGKHTVQRLQVPAAGNRSFGRNSLSSSPPRPQHMYTRSSSCNSRPVRGIRHEIPLPGNRLRRHRANKEILRRALTPPVRRQSGRWWNFRPTPSRLCNMSMA
ncbi:hypothetical protein Vadar_010086 [Vaccinium darrowii]|uniref:Uncharacterized protein n=1 Tax=Vaccinium darrowii TaxID=229202 RepID=A0ACB7Z476_9ERIC|nr:hypothetical protein Vadar_010086 [Vaccinium darrowii]